ncbi:hypothetical protein FACS1894218_2430 [Bacilli bacterium]|nr:hypothetical protein FACS1894218_2430 [Bacilli bacterium]
MSTALIIIYGYKMKSPESMEFASLVNNFADHNFYSSLNNVIVFYDGQFNFQIFSIFSVFAVAFKHFLGIRDADLNIYLYFQQIITFSVVLGWTITGFAYKIINQNK